MKVKQLNYIPYLKSLGRTGQRVDQKDLILSDDIMNIHAAIEDISTISNKTSKIGEVSPIENGVYGSNIIVDPNAKSGFLYSNTHKRPKTILEVLQSVAAITNLPTNSDNLAQILLMIQNRIGANMFTYSTNIIDDKLSLDGRLKTMENILAQLIADIFNRGKALDSAPDETIYRYTNTNGRQTQEYSIRDLIDKLMNIHNGVINIGHQSLGSTIQLPSLFNNGNDKLISNGAYYTSPYSNIISNTYGISVYTYPLSNDAILNKLFITVSSNTSTSNTKVTLMINGQKGKESLYIPSGATGNFNIYLDEKIKMGDKVEFEIMVGNGGPTNNIVISSINIIGKEVLR